MVAGGRRSWEENLGILGEHENELYYARCLGEFVRSFFRSILISSNQLSFIQLTTVTTERNSTGLQKYSR